ncbi:helix-turn-helix domain-containing protein [Cysteiniphilum sp. 6C5]|uniref:helix-turn-helix domain-containing protein n=1 Tax=unclassified Cysteiniphilum TaxID=2610889 RepID=UPI003F849D0E
MGKLDHDLTYTNTDNTECERQLKLVGFNLRRCMLSKGVNSVELHNNLGVSTGTVSKIVNGKCMPNLLTIYSITQYLEIKIDDLFNDPHSTPIRDSQHSKLA